MEGEFTEAQTLKGQGRLPNQSREPNAGQASARLRVTLGNNERTEGTLVQIQLKRAPLVQNYEPKRRVAYRFTNEVEPPEPG